MFFANRLFAKKVSMTKSSWKGLNASSSKAWVIALGMTLAIAGTVQAENEIGVLALAQVTETEAVAAESAPANSQGTGVKVKNEALRQHLMNNVDIFGKSDLSAIYILGPGLEDFEGQLLVRDFSRDPFFMQNIDREEFEMKAMLRDFVPEKEEDESEKR
jgi:hypothetical protein